MKSTFSSVLLCKTQDLLKNRHRDISLKRISDETTLSLRWLENFSRGVVEEPGVKKVEELYNYLNGSPLKL